MGLEQARAGPRRPAQAQRKLPAFVINQNTSNPSKASAARLQALHAAGTQTLRARGPRSAHARAIESQQTLRGFRLFTRPARRLFVHACTSHRVPANPHSAASSSSRGRHEPSGPSKQTSAAPLHASACTSHFASSPRPGARSQRARISMAILYKYRRPTEPRRSVWLCARNARVARDDEARWALLAAPLDASPTLDPKTRRQRFPRHHLLASPPQPALDLDLTRLD